MSDYEKLNQSLRQEICSMTPNRIDDLLARLDEPLEAVPAPSAYHRAGGYALRRLAAAVLALVILGSAVFWGVMRTRSSIVVIDADASVAFSVDGFDRVRSVRLEDPRAVLAIDAEHLTGMRLDEAVEDVAEQMIDADCLTPKDNAVLVSVLENGVRRAGTLARKTGDALSAAASRRQIAPAVLVQTLPESHVAAPGTGSGKTALVEKMVGDVHDANSASLLDASVQDLMYYAERQKLDISDSSMVGELAPDAYCSEQDAIQAAVNAAGLSPDWVQAGAILGWQESELVYIVTLQAEGYLRLYCVDARTGEVLDDYTPELPASEPDTPEPSAPQGPGPGSSSQPAPTAAPAPTPAEVPQPASDGGISWEGLIRFWGDIDDLF